MSIVGGYDVLVNDDKTRSFVCLRVRGGRQLVLQLIDKVDPLMRRFKQPEYYEVWLPVHRRLDAWAVDISTIISTVNLLIIVYCSVDNSEVAVLHVPTPPPFVNTAVRYFLIKYPDFTATGVKATAVRLNMLWHPRTACSDHLCTVHRTPRYANNNPTKKTKNGAFVDPITSHQTATCLLSSLRSPTHLVAGSVVSPVLLGDVVVRAESFGAR